MEPSAAAAGFGHLFSWRHPATMDLSHAAYRYNQNMMEYYTCKSKSVLYFSSIDINCLVVMFRSSVLDRGPPGPRVFWEDRDRTKTDPQRPKDRRSFSVLKLADFWPIC